MHQFFKVFKVSPSSEQNKTFSVIPHLLLNKEYLKVKLKISHIFLHFLCFSGALITKYLKLIKVNTSVLALNSSDNNLTAN